MNLGHSSSSLTSRQSSGLRSTSRISSSVDSQSGRTQIRLEWPVLVHPKLEKHSKKKRVDVLHPPTVQRRTVALETGNQHAHNHSRVVNMQQKMYMDYINSRKPAFYGTARHREDYKRSLRESLKAQMQESADKRRHEFNRSCSESRKAISDFHSSSRAEMELSRSMLSNSRHYMEENKKIAEERRHYIREQRRIDLQRERELLLKTPINWSYTLK